MDFLLELEIEILHEIKRDGITSFTDFVAYFLSASTVRPAPIFFGKN